MRNIFFEKLHTEFGGEAIPRLFYEKSKLIIFLDQHSELL